MADKQNPGWRAGASCDQIGICSRKPSSLSRHQAQFLKARFGLPRSIANEVSSLFFGEAAND